ncbi:MAG: type II toxin-antitoxin system VapC family toxin [Thermomicrobiales bacterium]
MLLSRAGRQVAATILAEIDGDDIAIIRVRETDEQRARAIIFQYDDKDFSLTDATSFAVMERLHIMHAFAFDHHFTQFGVTILGPTP